jgi:hypothetical protein
LDRIERPSEVENATILALFGGLLHILYGVNFHMRVAPLDPLISVFGPIMSVLGILSIGACIGLSLMNSWARKLVTGVGLAISGAHILFGYYLMAAMSAIIYWLAISQLKNVAFNDDSDRKEKESPTWMVLSHNSSLMGHFILVQS